MLALRKKAAEVVHRIRLLTPRVKLLWKLEWVHDDGTIEATQEKFGTVWRIAGVHSHNWKWVRKYGKLECGCTRNPITRRMVLFLWRCPVHMKDVDDNLGLFKEESE